MIPVRNTGVRSTQRSVAIPVHCTRCGRMIRRPIGLHRWNNMAQTNLIQSAVCGACRTK